MTTGPWGMFSDPSRIDESLDARAVTFENPTGERGAGGRAAGGRKGSPFRVTAPGETVVLADLTGPGTVRHIWCTVPPRAPEVLRALRLDVFYDGSAEPSVSVPLLDFFGLPHGRCAPYASALTAVQEGRGFNAWFPMPFREGMRIEFTNHAERKLELYYQIDYTLQPWLPDDAGLLHAEFRRENPTVLRDDFTITGDWRGPGRFLGTVVGVRTIDPALWYGEGEVKIFRDGDTDLPTVCGTGLEDYVGTAWGMGPHQAPFSGAPVDVRDPDDPVSMPAYVGFYRWHVPDPIVFSDELRVTIQQVGMHMFFEGQEELAELYRSTNPMAGSGPIDPPDGVIEMAIYERVDDYCATSFVYCREAQPVQPYDVAVATADVARCPYEQPGEVELMFG